MDDLSNWRRRIGGFQGGRPRVRRKWDPYGGGRKLDWVELLMAVLCFVATVLAAYAFLDEEHQIYLKSIVRCTSLLDDPVWRRRRGRECGEDAMPSGLTLGGVSAISALSTWGVHELHRRLRLVWDKGIEDNPGPQTPRKYQDTAEDPTRKSRAAREPEGSQGSGVFDAAENAFEGTRDGAAESSLTREGAAQPGRASGITPEGGASTSSDTESVVPSHSTVTAEASVDDTTRADARVGTSKIRDFGVTTPGATTSATGSSGRGKESEGRPGAGEGVGARRRNDCEEGSSGSGSDSKKGHTGSKKRKSRRKKSMAFEMKGSGKNESGKNEERKAMSKSKCEREKSSNIVEDLVVDDDVVDDDVRCEEKEHKSDDSRESEEDELSVSMRSVLSATSELEEMLTDTSEEESENELVQETEAEGDRPKKDDKNKKHKDRGQGVEVGKSGGNKDREGSASTKRDRGSKKSGLVNFFKDQMQAMVGAIEKLSKDLKGGQAEVKEKQESLTRGQEELKLEMRQGQAEMREEMRNEIQGVQKSQEEGKQQMDQVLQKMEATQTKLEGISQEIKKTQEEVKQNRADIQKLQEKQEETNTKAEQTQTAVEQELDRLDANSRRNNLKFFGVPEEGQGQREDSEGVVVKLLNRFFPEGGWRRGHCEKAQRLGQRREEGSKPRPLLAALVRPGDARRILAHKRGRTEMREWGVTVSSDLTARQQGQLKDLKSTGQRGYFYKGTLYIDDQNDRGGRGGGRGGRGEGEELEEEFGGGVSHLVSMPEEAVPVAEVV